MNQQLDAINAAMGHANQDGDLSGKYLTFRLSDQEYGVEILKVREIIGLMDITIVPRTPNFIRGVINLRGKIIPVIDLRVKFGMCAVADTDLSCIIVVDVDTGDQSVQTGLLVDTVCEVLDIGGSNIEPTPAFGGDVQTNFILGMARIEEDVKILLNIEDVLNGQALLPHADLTEASAGLSAPPASDIEHLSDQAA